MGIPFWLCMNEDCSTAWGFWSWLVTLVPFNGEVVVYHGSYWAALWDWLFD